MESQTITEVKVKLGPNYFVHILFFFIVFIIHKLSV